MEHAQGSLWALLSCKPCGLSPPCSMAWVQLLLLFLLNISYPLPGSDEMPQVCWKSPPELLSAQVDSPPPSVLPLPSALGTSYSIWDPTIFPDAPNPSTLSQLQTIQLPLPPARTPIQLWAPWEGRARHRPTGCLGNACVPYCSGRGLPQEQSWTWSKWLRAWHKSSSCEHLKKACVRTESGTHICCFLQSRAWVPGAISCLCSHPHSLSGATRSNESQTLFQWGCPWKPTARGWGRISQCYSPVGSPTPHWKDLFFVQTPKTLAKGVVHMTLILWVKKQSPSGNNRDFRHVSSLEIGLPFPIHLLSGLSLFSLLSVMMVLSNDLHRPHA